MTDHRDLALEQLAADEADLREANRQLVDLVADLAFENSVLRVFYDVLFDVSRIYGNKTLERLRRILDERQRAA